MRARVVALVLLLPLAACGMFVNKEGRAMRRTPEYRSGYQDGCDSALGPDANKRNGRDQVKDEQLFASSKPYRVGWSAGLGACRTNTPRNTTPPNSGPIRDQNPGSGILP